MWLMACLHMAPGMSPSCLLITPFQPLCGVGLRWLRRGDNVLIFPKEYMCLYITGCSALWMSLTIYDVCSSGLCKRVEAGRCPVFPKRCYFNSCCLVIKSCLFCDPMDCSPPGSSVHGISQARILKWLPFPSPGDLPDPGITPASPELAGRFFTTGAAWEALFQQNLY